MRTVKLVWSIVLDATTSCSIEQELVVGDDESPQQLGHDAYEWLEQFREGMAASAADS
jgi:hypothetical protein